MILPSLSQYGLVFEEEEGWPIESQERRVRRQRFRSGEAKMGRRLDATDGRPGGDSGIVSRLHARIEGEGYVRAVTSAAIHLVKSFVATSAELIPLAALDTPFLLLPFRPTSDPSAARTFIRHFFDRGQLHGAALEQELRLTEPMVSFLDG